MSGNHTGDDQPIDLHDESNGEGRKIKVSIELSGEQAAAVEGWRAANRIPSHSHAVRELVRIGLLSEIGRIYRMIADGKDREELVADGQDLTN